MPPRTRKPDEATALEGEPERQPGPASMFTPAIEAAKAAMSTRMDTIEKRLIGSMEELRMGQQALAEALGEVETAATGSPDGQPSGGKLDELAPVITQMSDALTEHNARLKQLEQVTGQAIAPDLADTLHLLDSRLGNHAHQLHALEQRLAAVGATDDLASLRAEIETLGVAIDELLAAQTGSMSAAMASDGFRTAGIEHGKHILSAIWAVMSEVTGVGL